MLLLSLVCSTVYIPMAKARGFTPYSGKNGKGGYGYEPYGGGTKIRTWEAFNSGFGVFKTPAISHSAIPPNGSSRTRTEDCPVMSRER